MNLFQCLFQFNSIINLNYSFHHRKIRTYKKPKTELNSFKKRELSWIRAENRKLKRTQVAKMVSLNAIILLSIILSVSSTEADSHHSFRKGAMTNQGGSGDGFQSLFNKRGNADCNCGCRCIKIYDMCFQKSIKVYKMNKEKDSDRLFAILKQCYGQKHLCERLCFFIFKSWDWSISHRDEIHVKEEPWYILSDACIYGFREHFLFKNKTFTFSCILKSIL